MLNAEQMAKLQKGDKVWFRTCYNDMNEGIVVGVSYPDAEYARVDRIGKAEKRLLTRPRDMFLTKEELIEANRDEWYAGNIDEEFKDHAFRVEKYMKEVYTMRQLIEMYRNFTAMKEVLEKKSEELLDSPNLFGHLF